MGTGRFRRGTCKSEQPSPFIRRNEYVFSFISGFDFIHFELTIFFLKGEEEREAARIAFENNRKRHYEMGKVLSKPIPEDDEDENDEDEGAEGPSIEQAAKRPASET